MRILLDGRDDVFMIDGPTRFEELIEEVKALCRQSGRALKTIKVDGEEISDEQLKEYENRDVNDFSSIEFITSGEIESALDELVKANSIILDTVDIVNHFLESGSMNYQDAVMSVINSMNTWERACRKIDEAARDLKIDYTMLNFSGISFKEQHKKSMEIIEKLTQALSDKDVVTIRDVLEYEFLPQIDTYKALIKEIVQKAGEESA